VPTMMLRRVNTEAGGPVRDEMCDCGQC
jgi:hypothetical protein